MPETLHRGFLIRRFSRDDVQNQKLESVGEEEKSLIKRKRFIERFKCVSKHHVYDIMVVIVSGFHLFPFRTEKLSPSAPMVLRIAGE